MNSDESQRGPTGDNLPAPSTPERPAEPGSGPPDPTPAPAADRFLGETLDGRYLVQSLLGEGGMGVVYLARHALINKRVAVKILRADLAREKEITERFLLEARAASSIGNPHIIDISDFGRLPDGHTYFVMEYLDGKPLGKVLEEVRPMPVTQLVYIARQIADGLSAAHERGIIHRDLKPDNIFLVTRGSEQDFVKILDFGIAKVSSEATVKLTRAGAVFGTPHYMSPEQAAGSPVDLRTDIYSLGVILYEMASGRVPFDADNFMGILTQHMYKAPIPIRALVPPQDVPPGLEAIVLKALSKKPEQRYQTMRELSQDLDKLGRGMVPDAVPEMMGRSGGFNVPADFFNERGIGPVPASPNFERRRRPWGLYAGLAGIAAAVGLVGAVLMRSSVGTALSRGDGAPGDAVRSAAATRAGGETAERLATALPAADPARPSASSKRVLLGAEPLDAHVFLGDKDLGTIPVDIDVPESERVTVELRREGYKSQRIVLDGSEEKKTVQLVRLSGKPGSKGAKPAVKGPDGTAAAAKPAAAPLPAAPLGAGEIVNPWAK